MPAGFRRRPRTFLVLALALAVATCTDTTGPTPTRPVFFVTPTGLETLNPPETFVGAGDIASCSKTGDSQTAALLADIPGPIFALGDQSYPDGTTSEWTNCYGPTWGQFKDRTYPAAGNHEYNTPNATPYYDYFGAAAGDPDKGYYSFDLGAWHVIVLNSNISRTASSPQVQWLRADLAAHPNLCTLAYWHHPLYSSTTGSGSGGVTYSSVRPFWDTLYAAGVDLVLNGHRHFYERLAPIKPDGSQDDSFGIRSFMVGSGGYSLGLPTNAFPRSEVRDGSAFGVLKLYLYDDSYAWKFIPVAGKTFSDSGSTACHPAPGGGGGGGGVSASQSTVSAAPGAITASTGASGSTITATVKDAGGNPLSGVTVTLSATGSGNTVTQPAGPTDAGGVATGSLSSTGAGAKTVTAVAGGVTLTQKPVVTVGPDVAAGLGFTGQPSNVVAGATITPAVRVEIRDQFGNAVTGATDDVSVAIGTNPAGGTLGGTTTVAAVSGVATFSTLTVDDPGTGYTLAAAAADLSGATSSGFNVVTPGAIPISHTLLTAGNDATNGKIYTSGAIAPAPNTLVTIALLSYRSYGATSPTVSGGGMASWEVVASVDFDDLALPRRRLTIYRAMSAAPGSGPLTFNFAATQSNAAWVVSQWDGVETSGVNGAGAIGQTGSNRADAVTTLAVTLAAFGDPSNVALGAFGVNHNILAITPGSGFTEISEQPVNEGTKGDLQTEWAVNRSTVNASWPTLRAGALGVEIKAKIGP